MFAKFTKVENGHPVHINPLQVVAVEIDNQRIADNVEGEHTCIIVAAHEADDVGAIVYVVKETVEFVVDALTHVAYRFQNEKM